MQTLAMHLPGADQVAGIGGIVGGALKGSIGKMRHIVGGSKKNVAVPGGEGAPPSEAAAVTLAETTTELPNTPVPGASAAAATGATAAAATDATGASSPKSGPPVAPV